MRPYQDQLARVERFLRRISIPSTNRDEYEDLLWAFFQNCWHLRDWILNDKKISARKKLGVNRGIKKSSALAICQCITNRTKHFKLTWPIPARLKQKGKWQARRIVRVLGGISVDIKDSVSGGDSATISLDYVIKSRTKTYRALTVAEDAVREWKQILSENRL